MAATKGKSLRRRLGETKAYDRSAAMTQYPTHAPDIWTRPGNRRRCRPRYLALLASIAMSVTATSAQAGVAIRGAQLVRNGQRWVPHGLVQIAFVAPPAAQAGVFAEAYRAYSPTDYAEMRRRGMDCVRIQVSQPGLDPQNPLFDPAFRSRIVEAVRAARAAGLVVIISVQDESQSGETNVAALPDDATRRVWNSLAPVFAADDGVMYELLNEPNLPPSPVNWRRWADAMNRTIAVVRHAGAHNVVLADGLLFAERLGGAPELDDPIGQVAYASHPYAHDADGQRQATWDRKFGDFASRHPVVVTEWTTVPTYFCDANTPRYAADFLRYLDGRGIGITAYAWDFSGPRFGSAYNGLPPRPTDYERKTCGDPGFGPGRLFERQADRVGPSR